jgi:hypothetical protein
VRSRRNCRDVIGEMMPAEEEVAVEEEVEKTRPLFIKMPIRNGVRTNFIVPARRGRF